MSSFIYGIHASDGVIRYIGQTKNLETRLFHIRENVSNNYLLTDWVKRHKGDIHQKLLEKCEPNQADRAEKYWIKKYRCDGYALLNIVPGGSEYENSHEHNTILMKQVLEHWTSECEFPPESEDLIRLRNFVAMPLKDQIREYVRHNKSKPKPSTPQAKRAHKKLTFKQKRDYARKSVVHNRYYKQFLEELKLEAPMEIADRIRRFLDSIG
jgi:hypothetical protein